MIYNFNFYITKDSTPYFTAGTAADYLAEVLENRTTYEKPLLEYRISNDLRNTSETELTEDERQHLLSVIVGLNIDNYVKGKLAQPLIV